MTELDTVAGDGWRSLIEEANAPATSFEARFAWLKQSGRYGDRLCEVEAELSGYFRSLILPNTPTLYDHMVLGLRGQDTIATFNWDPFLLATYERHVGRFGQSRLPDLRFLHGSTVYATCDDHDVIGYTRSNCTVCGKALRSVDPLYPVAEKDYVSDPLLKREWDVVLPRLQSAFQLTIIGYSGPVTDGEARRLLGRAWSLKDRRTDHLEVVDRVAQACLETRWRTFIPFSHLIACIQWEESSIARWPRRTSEWKQAASLEGKPAQRVGPCPAKSLETAVEWYSAIAEFEEPWSGTTRDGLALAGPQGTDA